MKPELICQLVKEVDKYYAHTSEKGRESLLAHTKLTYGYFQKIFREKEVEDFKRRFFQVMFEAVPEKGILFFDEMIAGISVFHDLGKINPEYQIINMGNDNVESNRVLKRLGKNHAMLSALLYIDYFRSLIKKYDLDKKTQGNLRPFILFHAYLIARHHTDLIDFHFFMEALQTGEGVIIIEAFSTEDQNIYQHRFSLSAKSLQSAVQKTKKYMDTFTQEQSIALYTYEKLMYSILLASDYYATGSYCSDVDVVDIGNLEDAYKWREVYESTELMKSVRKHQENTYPMNLQELGEVEDINALRTEMLCEAEETINHHSQEHLFYLEAPTGSGKSNMAINLGFQLMKADKRLKKILYIYPFNTLVEQNRQSLCKIFGNSDVVNDIAVVNSVTPVKLEQEDQLQEKSQYYQKALLDRQFLNYPMVLSTHVSLFDILFGDKKDSAFGFHQLMNSVVILDEIQSYRNEIWGEIICFLNEMAPLLNMKILIMSATLPNLESLYGGGVKTVRLISNPEKYFDHKYFKSRVKLYYELLEREDVEEALMDAVLEKVQEKKKIMLEFIKKSTAEDFCRKIRELRPDKVEVELFTGDDSAMERKRILDKVRASRGPFVLVATQVVEAGVDIDMEIGYKNISKLDSEEQFLGRINRSAHSAHGGEVYFFKLDEGKNIYRNDIRMASKELTLENESMREILETKKFNAYYAPILETIKNNYNRRVREGGLDFFFREMVGALKFSAVKETMKLIEENKWSMQVYLARRIQDETGDILDGKELWDAYKNLLQNYEIGYAEKKVTLSFITSKMSNFIYQIKKNVDLQYNDQIGDIFYIDEGEKFFDDGKVNRRKIQGEIGDFVDFI